MSRLLFLIIAVGSISSALMAQTIIEQPGVPGGIPGAIIAPGAIPVQPNTNAYKTYTLTPDQSYYSNQQYYNGYNNGYNGIQPAYGNPYNSAYGTNPYYGSLPPPEPNQAFPDKAQSDALYQQIQSR